MLAFVSILDVDVVVFSEPAVGGRRSFDDDQHGHG